MVAIVALTLLSGCGTLAHRYGTEIPGTGLLHLLTNVDSERSFPTAYSVLALFVSALIQGLIAIHPALAPARQRRGWKILGAIFLYLSLDELLGFHELAIDPLRTHFHLDGIFYFAWTLPAIALFGIFLLTFFRFWLALPPRIRLLFLAAAMVFVGGAVGTEMVNGYYLSQAGPTLVYALLQHLEEFCEMTGIAIFIYALLSYICLQLGQPVLKINLQADRPGLQPRAAR